MTNYKTPQNPIFTHKSDFAIHQFILVLIKFIVRINSNCKWVNYKTPQNQFFTHKMISLYINSYFFYCYCKNQFKLQINSQTPQNQIFTHKSDFSIRQFIIALIKFTVRTNSNCKWVKDQTPKNQIFTHNNDFSPILIHSCSSNFKAKNQSKVQTANGSVIKHLENQISTHTNDILYSYLNLFSKLYLSRINLNSNSQLLNYLKNQFFTHKMIS